MKKYIFLSLIIMTIFVSGCALITKEPKEEIKQENPWEDLLDTSTWKTYENKEYGYSFMYPRKMSIQHRLNKIDSIYETLPQIGGISSGYNYVVEKSIFSFGSVDKKEVGEDLWKEQYNYYKEKYIETPQTKDSYWEVYDVNNLSYVRGVYYGFNKYIIKYILILDNRMYFFEVSFPMEIYGNQYIDVKDVMNDELDIHLLLQKFVVGFRLKDI